MDDWQLRKEARRCSYNAMHARLPSERKMFQGLAAFYSQLAQSDVPEPDNRGRDLEKQAGNDPGQASRAG